MEDELQKTERSFKNQVNYTALQGTILCYLIQIITIAIIQNPWTYFLMGCLFQIATHEKKAHDNWVRFFFSFLLVQMTKVAALGGELKDKEILNVDFNMHLEFIPKWESEI